jgi:hypothetical protein
MKSSPFLEALLAITPAKGSQQVDTTIRTERLILSLMIGPSLRMRHSLTSLREPFQTSRSGQSCNTMMKILAHLKILKIESSNMIERSILKDQYN